jgi:predicted phage tail protein
MEFTWFKISVFLTIIILALIVVSAILGIWFATKETAGFWAKLMFSELILFVCFFGVAGMLEDNKTVIFTWRKRHE